MKTVNKGHSVWIHDVGDFCLQHIFECGQAFRWNKEDSGSYTGVVGNKAVRAKYNEDDKVLILENCTLEEYESHWKHYFDLDRDYARIKKELSADKVMKAAVRHGWGIRVLNQDPWETLISFIISANNNIKRIQTIIEKLSEHYGNEIEWEGKLYYTFPAPEALASAREEDLRACGCGYRGPYIKETARMVADGILSPYKIKKLPYEEAHKELLRFPGVGPKVADCILLFSMEKTEAFPVDVWLRRVMEYFYTDKPMPPKQIKLMAGERFGKHAGLAQQYLFYYAREMQIGKE